VKIINCTYSSVGFTIITLINCVLFLLFFSLNSLAQNSKADIELVFVKPSDSIKTSELCFNSVKIWNNSSKPITGNVQFSGPENWTIISFPAEQTLINPGDTIWIPMRVSPATNAIGGIAYIINATFRTSQRIVSANTYLTIPALQKWEFSTNTGKLYFTQSNPNPNFKIQLSNKGNTTELIKLHIQVGKLLKFSNDLDNDYVEFVNLPAFKDTTVLHSVSYQGKLNYADKLRYENNWRESAVKVTASTEKMQRSSEFQIRKLNSTYINQRTQVSSPLNFDYQMYNLMSSQPIRSNLKVFGSILFPKDRQIQYFTGLQNIYYDKVNKANFDVNRQLIYSLIYTDKRNTIQLGYNVSGGGLHTINGRGLTGSHIFKNNSRIAYAFTQNIYNNTLGEYLGYSINIKNVLLNTGVTHDSNYNGTYDATSVSFGTGLNLFKYHTISFQLLGSRVNYNNTQYNDTSVLGFSYNVNYNIRYKKFSFSINSMNSQHNYIRNSGLQQTYIDGKYKLNTKVEFILYGNRQLYATTRYPYNFYNTANYNSTDYLRLIASISDGNIVYQVGPNYNGYVRQVNSSLSNFKSEYITYQPGLWLAATVKLGGYRSITPNLTVNNVRFRFNTDNPALVNYSSNKNIYYSAGISYFDQVFRVNAYYSSGSVSDMYRSIQVVGSPVVSRSIQCRPSYENFFFDRKVKLSAYANYAYYMPSGRENITFNVKYDQFLKKGWNFYVSGFMYTNVRVADDYGRIATKDLNFIIGINKSFNIQQPRLKYYDFKSVFFNDLDGDRIKSKNEPPVTNVLVNVVKDISQSKGQGTIPEINLITDAKGEINIVNLPSDNYKLSFTPLQNLEYLYFLNGSTESYSNDRDNTLYVPLTESYKIKGKIVVVRDPNSSEGKIELAGIRITATGEKGETYSELTDNSGAFILSVPKADKYLIHINNVFGEYFYIDANEVQVQFAENKTINVDFTFIEKKRGIQFDGENQFFNFNSIDSESANSEITSNQAEPGTAEPRESYAIQLGTLKTFREPIYFKTKYKLKGEVLYTVTDGEYKYYTGDYTTLKEAKAAISKSGLIAVIPVAIDRATLKSAKPVEKIQQVRAPALMKNTELQSQAVIREGKAAVTSESASQLTIVNKGKEVAELQSAIKNSEPVKTESITLQVPKTTVAKGNLDEKQQSTSIQPVSSQPVTIIQSKPVANESVAQKSVGNSILKPVSMPTADLKVAPVKQQSGANQTVSSKPAVKTTAQILDTQAAVTKNNQIVKLQPASTKQTALQTVGSNKIYLYTIQLDASKIFRDPTYYKNKFSLPFDVICVERDGVRSYYAGSYESEDVAKADIARYGITGFIVPIEESKDEKPNTQK